MVSMFHCQRQNFKKKAYANAVFKKRAKRSSYNKATLSITFTRVIRNGKKEKCDDGRNRDFVFTHTPSEE